MKWKLCYGSDMERQTTQQPNISPSKTIFLPSRIFITHCHWGRNADERRWDKRHRKVANLSVVHTILIIILTLLQGTSTASTSSSAPEKLSQKDRQLVAMLHWLVYSLRMRFTKLYKWSARSAFPSLDGLHRALLCTQNAAWIPSTIAVRVPGAKSEQNIPTRSQVHLYLQQFIYFSCFLTRSRK